MPSARTAMSPVDATPQADPADVVIEAAAGIARTAFGPDVRILRREGGIRVGKHGFFPKDIVVTDRIGGNGPGGRNTQRRAPGFVVTTHAERSHGYRGAVHEDAVVRSTPHLDPEAALAAFLGALAG